MFDFGTKLYVVLFKSSGVGSSFVLGGIGFMFGSWIGRIVVTSMGNFFEGS